MTYIEVLKFSKQDVMVDNVEGLFEVDKQCTNIALVVESLQPRMLNSDYQETVPKMA